MTLPSSGPLSLSDIQGEFGGSNPIGIDEYYAGGGLVPGGTISPVSGPVPSSGTISIASFYGTSNSPFVPVTNTYNSGSGNETVPTGASQLVVTAYGAGGRGGDYSVPDDGGGGGGGSKAVKTIAISSGQWGSLIAYVVGTGTSTPVDTTVSGLSIGITAGSGQVGNIFTVPGSGGVASGGDTNTNGDAGSGSTGGNAASGGGAGGSSGVVGSAPGGGGGGANSGAGFGAGANGQVVFAWT